MNTPRNLAFGTDGLDNMLPSQRLLESGKKYKYLIAPGCPAYILIEQDYYLKSDTQKVITTWRQCFMDIVDGKIDYIEQPNDVIISIEEIVKISTNGPVKVYKDGSGLTIATETIIDRKIMSTGSKDGAWSIEYKNKF